MDRDWITFGLAGIVGGVAGYFGADYIIEHAKAMNEPAYRAMVDCTLGNFPIMTKACASLFFSAIGAGLEVKRQINRDYSNALDREEY